MRLDDLASILEASYDGDGAYEVDGIATIEKAQASHLSFVASAKYEKYLEHTKAGIVVLSPSSSEKYTGNKIITPNTYLAYALLSKVFSVRSIQDPTIHESAVISVSAVIGRNVSIGANCVVADGAEIGDESEIYPGTYIGEKVKIGNNALIFANVSIYHEVSIGKNCVIHSGTVIGSDGFGFAPNNKKWLKIHQLGSVMVGDNVEIGANCSIDRGALENTIIEDDVIIDNLVHIAHNVIIGEGSAIAGCAGFAGSVKLGKNCTVAGMVGFAGHLEIADNSHFLGGTIVTRGNKEAATFASAPPMTEVKKWRRNSVRYRQLDEWVDRIAALEKNQEKPE